MASSNAIIQCTSSSSSSSHTTKTYTYDVFVSFRGEDTRNNFAGFLFQALRKKGIDAFKDDADLKKGESIAPELLQAIQGSRIFVVVFSNNYASSTWCLRELAEILNCIQTSPRLVLPIFYDVDPSEVRKQSGCYQKAFAEHEERFRQDIEMMEEVQRWRETLTTVSNISGSDIRNKPQHAEIEQIVQRIIDILGPKFLSLPNDNLVGMQSPLEELAELLRLGSVDDEIRVVGITGMSGIGKSTLAHALYERISHHYGFNCFIDDVSKIYQDSKSLGVQKELLSHCKNEKNLEICNVSEGTHMVWTRLRNVRALVVLDNVDHVRQLEMFTGNRDTLLRECLGGGSRIIIISRDEHILRTHGVDDVYQVQPLNYKDAVQLFCRNAFKGNDITSDYEEFTKVILSHAGGHPLALKVVGSSLFGRNVSQWRSALARLRENKSKDIMDVLRIGFDELDDMNKEIFLDIACFFNGFKVKHVQEILDFRGFHPEYGLQVLVDKSLITTEYSWIHMHGLLKDLGRSFVQEKSPKEPRNWSRLWECQDLHKITSNNMAAKNLEAIAVDGHCIHEAIRADSLSKMNHLKLLKLESVRFSGSLNHLSNELGYLSWVDYPFECLPPSFQPDKLVELSLHRSNVKELWKDRKPLHNLRRLDLSYSRNLIKIPYLGDALNLEYLNLKGCEKIKQIDPSIGHLSKLNVVSLQCCTSLVKLPHFREDLNLETLDLEGCIQLRKINSSIGLLRMLTFLNLKDCKSLVSLPNTILGLNSLNYLNLSGCSKLQLLDEPMRDAPIRSHSTLSVLKRWLYPRAHKDSVSCLLLSSSTFPCMRQLELSFCNLVQIPDVIGNLSCLERLNLSGNNFATLPSLKELSKLYDLNLEHCKQLQDLPQLPSRTDNVCEMYTPPSSTSGHLAWAPDIWYNKTPSFVVYGAGLNIFNCPAFVGIERERCTCMIISWMIQILESYQFSFLLKEIQISSIIPGSEIPRWFNNQHVAMDRDCMAVLCWVVIGGRLGRRVRFSASKTIPVVFDEDLVTDKSDHVWLFSLNAYPFTDNSGSLLERGIKVTDREGFYIEVKKFGIVGYWKHADFREQGFGNSRKEAAITFRLNFHENEELEASLNMEAIFATTRPNKDPQ